MIYADETEEMQYKYVNPDLGFKMCDFRVFRMFIYV